MIHIQLCRWVSDKNFFYPVNFWKKLYFFLTLSKSSFNGNWQSEYIFINCRPMWSYYGHCFLLCFDFLLWFSACPSVTFYPIHYIFVWVLDFLYAFRGRFRVQNKVVTNFVKSILFILQLLLLFLFLLWLLLLSSLLLMLLLAIGVWQFDYC